MCLLRYRDLCDTEQLTTFHIYFEAMDNVYLRAKVFCRHGSMILWGLGRPYRRKQPSTVPLKRILHQSLSSRLISEMNSSICFAGKIGKVQYGNKPFFNFARRHTFSLLNDCKCSTVEGRLYSTTKNLHKLEPQVRSKGLYILMQGIRIICLITGISVWILLVAVLFFVDELKVDTVDRDDVFPSEEWAIQRSFKFLDTPEGHGLFAPDLDWSSKEAEQIKSEINTKLNAIGAIWEKLKVDDMLQHSLGNTIEVFGYKCCEERGSTIWNVDQNEKSTKWVANCYIEGSNGLAMLSVMFERPDTESEWVATKLYVEKIKESGEVICNVSSSLPNGLKHFTRLSGA